MHKVSATSAVPRAYEKQIPVHPATIAATLYTSLYTQVSNIFLVLGSLFSQSTTGLPNKATVGAPSAEPERPVPDAIKPRPAAPPAKIEPPRQPVNKQLTTSRFSGELFEGFDPCKNLDAHKKYIVQKALGRWKELNLTCDYTIEKFQDNSDFTLKPNKIPAYFNRLIEIPTEMPEIEYTSGYYDYIGSPLEHIKSFFVNFANKYLGGGVLGKGFVQEEIMMLQTPDMFTALFHRPGHRTRVAGEGALQGSPAPLIFNGVHRVLEIDNCLYGHGLYNTTPLEIEKQNLVRVLENAVEFNSLAIAAPILRDKTPELQFHLNTICDIINTVYAGFFLAIMSAANESKGCFIGSGLFGCGAFNNNPILVICIKILIAHCLGAQLKLYGVSEEQMQTAREVWRSAFGAGMHRPCIVSAAIHLNEALRSYT